MNELYEYYVRNLSMKKIIFKKISLSAKVVILTIGILFIYQLITFQSSNESYSLLKVLFFEMLLIFSMNIAVNQVSTEKYGLRKSIENIFGIKWAPIDTYRKSKIKEYLLANKINTPKQIEMLISKAKENEKESRFQFLFSKTIFTASLIALISESISYNFNRSTMNPMSLFFTILLILIIASAIIMFFESFFISISNILFSKESNRYKQLRKIIEEIYIESGNTTTIT